MPDLWKQALGKCVTPGARQGWRVVTAVALVLLAAACQPALGSAPGDQAGAQARPAVTANPTNTPVETRTRIPTAMPPPTRTASPTATPSPTVTLTPTSIPTSSSTPTWTPRPRIVWPTLTATVAPPTLSPTPLPTQPPKEKEKPTKEKPPPPTPKSG